MGLVVRRRSKKYEILRKSIDMFRSNPKARWVDLMNIFVKAGVSLPYAEKIVKELSLCGIARKEGNIYEIDVETLERILRDIEKE